jgi:hypothetical protein
VSVAWWLRLGALEMTGGRRAEPERLACSRTAPAQEVRQVKALLWAAAEGTAAVGALKSREPGLHDAAGSA